MFFIVNQSERWLVRVQTGKKTNVDPFVICDEERTAVLSKDGQMMMIWQHMERRNEFKTNTERMHFVFRR